jgi:hypothetical protein
VKKKRLTRDELAVVEALVGDVAATVGVSDRAAYTSWLIAETLDLLSRTTEKHDLISFRDYVVEDFQQRMHDEFIDVSWPRCPRHPNHPMWLKDGAWWCTKENVPIAPLGELPAAPSK